MLVAILFMDNINVIHFLPDSNEMVDQMHLKLQESVLSWGNLLIAMGGSLNYHFISFDWKPDGRWVFANNKDKEEFSILVLLLDMLVTISHLGVNKASRTLGTMTCHSGDSSQALCMITEKAQGWINTAKNTLL